MRCTSTGYASVPVAAPLGTTSLRYTKDSPCSHWRGWSWLHHLKTLIPGRAWRSPVARRACWRVIGAVSRAAHNGCDKEHGNHQDEATHTEKRLVIMTRPPTVERVVVTTHPRLIEEQVHDHPSGLRRGDPDSGVSSRPAGHDRDEPAGEGERGRGQRRARRQGGRDRGSRRRHLGGRHGHHPHVDRPVSFNHRPVRGCNLGRVQPVRSRLRGAQPARSSKATVSQ